MRLQPLELRLPRGSGSLCAQVEQALAAYGRPLRWAITGVEAPPGHSDAVVTGTATPTGTPIGVATLLIEAVVIADGPALSGAPSGAAARTA